MCGNCSRGDQCNHVNGSCLNGCDVGVYGDKCDKGKFYNLITICGFYEIIFFYPNKSSILKPKK